MRVGDLLHLASESLFRARLRSAMMLIAMAIGVAAVVVLREGHTATERELQAFVSVRAAESTVPKKILFMAEIPKGATGKLQRIGMAAKLGLV
mgnify:CR=1 FL=1